MQEMQKTEFPSLSWEESLEEEMAPYTSTFAGKLLGQSSLLGSRRGGHKELDATE